MTPKHKSRNADNLDMPTRGCKVIPLREKVKALDLIKKEKNSQAEFAKIYGKNESSFQELVKKEKEMCVSFPVIRQTAKFMATVGDKCLVKMCLEDMHRKCVLIDGSVLAPEGIEPIQRL